MTDPERQPLKTALLALQTHCDTTAMALDLIQESWGIARHKWERSCENLTTTLVILQAAEKQTLAHIAALLQQIEQEGKGR